MFTIIFTIFSLLSASSFNFERGTTYLYQFSSTSSMSGEKNTGEEKYEGIEISSSVALTCTFVSDQGYLFEMGMTNVAFAMTENGQRVPYDQPTETEAHFANSLVFTLTYDGRVVDVQSAEEDEGVLNVKLAVIYTLASQITGNTETVQSRVTIDHMGRHNTHTSTKVSGRDLVMTSFFTAADFLNFRDPRVPQKSVGFNAKSSVVVRDGIITSASAEAHADFENQEAEKKSEFAMFSDSKNTLIYTAAARAKKIRTVPRALTTIAAVRSSLYPAHRPVAFLQDSFFTKQADAVVLPVGEFGPRECPTDLGLCYSYGGKWEFGDESSFTLAIDAKFVVGTNKGCDSPTRNWLGGVYATVDATIMGFISTSVEALVEYGYVNNVPRENGVVIRMLGEEVYRYTFPVIDCYRKTFELGSWEFSFPFTYTVMVWILPIDFTAKFTVGATVAATLEACATNVSAYADIYPVASIKAAASVSTTVVIVKGGIELSVNSLLNVRPQVYARAGDCTIGSKAVLHLEPVHVKFVGWYELMSLPWGKWKAPSYITFFEWSAAPVDWTIYDVSYQIL